jgi:hypothetical protein
MTWHCPNGPWVNYPPSKTIGRTFRGRMGQNGIFPLKALDGIKYESEKNHLPRF